LIEKSSDEKPEERMDEPKQVSIAEESPQEQEPVNAVQDEKHTEEQVEKLEEKPADDINSEPDSMGWCGLRKRKKPENKPEEPKVEEPNMEEPEPESKVTCCGMKRSSHAVDDELESSEQVAQPQKLDTIKEESTTGSEQLKRDSVPESQQVQKAETK